MSDHEPSPAFQDAAAYLSTSNAQPLSNVSTSVKLELYGLFKYITVSPCPLASRPSIFDMTGRAKWDAWNASGQSYGHQSAAESRYLDIAKSLGWVQGSIKETSGGSSERADEAGIWEDGSSTGSNSGGMGNSVSFMARPPSEECDTSTIHGLAVAGDAAGLKLFLQDHPEADINEKDEFGYTPLHLACDRGRTAVVRMLLSNGADRKLKDADDLTASEIAREAGHDEMERLLR